MKVAACVLTRNQYEHGRRDLFERTVDSLKTAGMDLYVVDNGSDDGTASLVRSAMDWTPYLSTDPNTTSGFGTLLCCRVVAGSGADIGVVSDDDMEWPTDSAEILTDWWTHAPQDVVLTGGHLEPEFRWNSITDRVTYGKTKGFLRASTGAASWTFLTDRYAPLGEALKAIPTRIQGTWDVPVCQHLRTAGLQIGQIDVAEHIGQGRSSWGNGTEQMYGWDVESVRNQLKESALP